MNKRKHIVYLVFLALVAALIISCTKEQPDPVNPYSGIDYSNPSGSEVPLDPYSIEGIHKTILSVKCNNPGCHDGTFEPDFRTIQSSYSTLVYQTPVKKTLDNINFFQFRVKPFDTAHSWLHERLTTPTFEYMPSNAVRLSRNEIQKINTWILNGAKDLNGNVPTGPNNLPNVTGYVAFDSVFKARFDTSRLNQIPYNPFILKYNRTVNLVFLVTDDTTQIKNMKLNQVRMSFNKDDFSSPDKSYNCQYVEAPDGKGGTLKLWYATFSTKDFSPGSTVYFRYYCNDITHAANTEFPRNESLFYYKSLYAFYVAP